MNQLKSGGTKIWPMIVLSIRFGTQLQTAKQRVPRPYSHLAGWREGLKCESGEYPRQRNT